jgi:hypothetical protein
MAFISCYGTPEFAAARGFADKRESIKSADSTANPDNPKRVNGNTAFQSRSLACRTAAHTRFPIGIFVALFPPAKLSNIALRWF